MIENAMVSGCFPYDAEYAPEPDYKCPRCSLPMQPADKVYEFYDDEWLCGECFVDAILSLSQADRADMAGESIVYTEQQLELVDYEAGAMAEILYCETKYAEDIA